jgi:hypothetical protein
MSMSRNLKKLSTQVDTLNIKPDESNVKPDHSLDMEIGRRTFIKGAAAVSVTTALVGLEPIIVSSRSTQLSATDIGPQTGPVRADASFENRNESSTAEHNLPIPDHPDNKDEDLYASHNYFASFTKGLLQNATTGLVNPSAYQALLTAIKTGTFAAFENLRSQFGCSDLTMARRMVNPLGGYAYELEGTDSHQIQAVPGSGQGFPIAPKFASRQEAAEAVELYWAALLRDVAFSDYPNNQTAIDAANDLTRFGTDYTGPQPVTPKNLFRDSYPGCTVGPYVSQFLLQSQHYGAQFLDARVASVPLQDYVTTFANWKTVHQGCDVPRTVPDFSSRHFIRTGRDLTTLVHFDLEGYNHYLLAALFLINGKYKLNVEAPENGNPYGPTIDDGTGQSPSGAMLTSPDSLAQTGFATFGGPWFTSQVARVAVPAGKNVWYQKWLVHRRLRPEEYGGWAEVQRRGLDTFPFNADFLNDPVLGRVFSKYGTYLLPLAFPEGSPMHSSYGSGHATKAGACVTMLKALFDENQPIKDPVMVDPNDPSGQTLAPFIDPSGAVLTVGGELNKLASNISQARNIAGVHWRTDANNSNLLGQETTISILKDQDEEYFETPPFQGFTFHRFNGNLVNVEPWP